MQRFLSSFIAFLALHIGAEAEVLNLRSRRSFRVQPDPSGYKASPAGSHLPRNRTSQEEEEEIDVWEHDGVHLSKNTTLMLKNGTFGKQPAEDNVTKFALNGTSQKAQMNLGDFAAYLSCYSNPMSCTVNVPKVAAELGNRVVLLFGCSIDIYSLDYFCKAANAPISGFARSPGNTYFAPGNFAWCKIGGLTLAYSFHPGSSGPPYFEACDAVLKTTCMGPTQLIAASVAQVTATFGVPPTAIVVDSSLWDAASWYITDGKPPEPYIAPANLVAKWCFQDFPALINAVQMAAPYSKIAFRTAPRVEFMKGYGHSMANIDAMNRCFKSSSLGNLMVYKMIDYNYIVEMMLARQGGAVANYFEDAFHPGLLPSVIYIDWVLQWVKSIPVAR